MLGICQLAAGFCCTRTIIRELPAKPRSWQLLSTLILMFAVGYALFAIYVSRGNFTSFTLIISLIFAAGGSFVFIVARLSRESIGEARRLASLEQENTRITNARRRLQTILDNAAEGVVTFNGVGQIESCNRATEELLGYRQNELVDQQISQFIKNGPDESLMLQPGRILNEQIATLAGQEAEMVACHASGREFALSVRISRIILDEEELFTALVSDISERKNMLDRLRVMAERDTTTSLYNRSYFQNQLEIALTCCDARRPVSLLYIDLDNFKMVNDVLGHAAGDGLLVEVGDMLTENLPENSVLARFGGDEFTALLPEVSVEAVVDLAEGLRENFVNYQFRRNGKQIDIGCSIGVSSFSESDSSAEQLMAQADMACHMAKRAGRNRVHLFEAEDQRDIETMALDIGWSRRIKQAIQNDQFILAGQPIMNISEAVVDCHEILLRMVDNDGSVIMPNAFMPAAERLGLASAIDKWVVDHAMELLADRRVNDKTARFSINLSAQTLSDETVWDLIESKLHETGLDPAALTFEVTETTAITNMKVAERLLNKLRGVGCHTALDDFGSGLCSFGYLRDLPVDVVKIDGRFVREMAINDVDVSIVNAINEVVHASGMLTVAEFVEDQAGLAMLQTIGVDFAQGYHLGEPVIFTDYEQCEKHRAA